MVKAGKSAAKRSKRTVGVTTTPEPEPAVAASLDSAGLLANERMLAQWCQTSIFLQAGGFALTQYGDAALRGPVGTLLIMAGAFVAVTGYQRYLRFGQLISGQRSDLIGDPRPFVQVSIVTGIAVLMAGLQIAGIW